jgi:hypothetical protein
MPASAAWARRVAASTFTRIWSSAASTATSAKRPDAPSAALLTNRSTPPRSRSSTRVELGGERFEPRLVARDEHHVETAPAERAREVASDAGGGAGHQRDLPRFELHRRNLASLLSGSP